MMHFVHDGVSEHRDELPRRHELAAIINHCVSHGVQIWIAGTEFSTGPLPLRTVYATAVSGDGTVYSPPALAAAVAVCRVKNQESLHAHPGVTQISRGSATIGLPPPTAARARAVSA